MQVSFAQTDIPFRPWRPTDGRTFEEIFAFDSETARIDEDRPWLTPPFVLGAACNGQKGYFILRDRAAAFFTAHRDVPVVMHHAPFDLAVLDLLAPSLRIYDKVDRHEVWDTQLLHRLLALGTDGHTASWKGQSTLEFCSDTYLGVLLPKDVQDASGNPVRLSYGQWLNKSPEEIEAVYLEYLAKDVLATFLVYVELDRRLAELLHSSGGVWGYASQEWLTQQVGQWGWQTHHIQLKAAIVLSQITANGLAIDLEQRDHRIQELTDVAREQMAILQAHGYLPGQAGSGKALQEILLRIERQHPELDLQRTATRKYATTEEALSELPAHEFVDALLKHRSVTKLQTSFLGKMGRQVLHPSFDTLKVTGRTSSFGELNAQNLPRDDRVRACFVPSPGHVFIKADYKTLEMATLAQAVQSQFGLESAMAVAINAGKDLHALVAASVAQVREVDVTAAQRQKAKPINFGKPGAMGNRALKSYAKASYGIDFDDDEVQELSESWLRLFPEMTEFLDDRANIGLAVAQGFDLTPTTYFEHTGSDKFLRHRDNWGREHSPLAALGWMCLKVLKEPIPTTNPGRPYTESEIDFFWSGVAHHISIIPTELRSAVNSRSPSPSLNRAVMRELGRAPVLTLTGRLRAKATYAARHNTVFQGLAADGAKLAMWKLWISGFRIVNFIHDEFLIEVRANANLRREAEEIRRVMIEGMRIVVPDVLIDVEYAACDRWYKCAEKQIDPETEALLLWHPPLAPVQATLQ